MGWQFAAGPWNVGPAGQLPATGRTVTFRVGPAAISEGAFTIDGGLPQAASLLELVSDVWCHRNGQLLLRGRLGAGQQETLDGTTHSWTPSFSDYRDRISRLQFYPTDKLVYASQDTGLTARQIVAAIQGHAAANVGITTGSETTGTSEAVTFQVGQSLGAALDQLAQLSPGGFDWDVLPTSSLGLLLTLWPNGRGTARPDVYEYGANVTKVTRQLDPTQFGNAALVSGGANSGGTTPAPVTVAAPGLTSRPEGRFDLAITDADVTDAGLLAARAPYELAAASTLVASYACTLKPSTEPGAWQGPSQLWIGDTATVKVKSGRLDVQQALRVQQIDIAIGDDGVEVPTVTFGQPRLDILQQIRAMGKTLAAVQRKPV